MIEIIYLNCYPILWHFPFLRHPVWWKFTLNKYVHVKGSQEAKTHMGKLFLESNYIDGIHISQFLAHIMIFSIFRTPCTRFWCILGQNVRTQTPQNYPSLMGGGSVFIHFALKCMIYRLEYPNKVFIWYFLSRTKNSIFSKRAQGMFSLLLNPCCILIGKT